MGQPILIQLCNQHLLRSQKPPQLWRRGLAKPLERRQNFFGTCAKPQLLWVVPAFLPSPCFLSSMLDITQGLPTGFDPAFELWPCGEQFFMGHFHRGLLGLLARDQDAAVPPGQRPDELRRTCIILKDRYRHTLAGRVRSRSRCTSSAKTQSDESLASSPNVFMT